METTTKKLVNSATIDSKELNAFLSQVGKNDPIQIKVQGQKLTLFSWNTKNDIKIIKGLENFENFVKSDFSISHKETLQRFTKIHSELRMEVSKDESNCTVTINGTSLQVDDGTTEAVKMSTGCNYVLDVKTLENTLTHCSKERNRYVYNGICLEISDREVVSMVATDGRRLVASQKISLSESLEVDQFVIHQDALKSAIAIAKKKKLPIIVWNSESNAMTIDDIIIESRPVEGKFPDWKKVVPEQTNFHVSAKRDELLAVLKQCKETTEKPSHSLKISVIDDSTLNFSTEIVDVMKKDYELGAEHNLENDFMICFNAFYLLDAIKMLEHHTVNLKLVDPNRPLVIEQENKTILVMPMKI